MAINRIVATNRVMLGVQGVQGVRGEEPGERWTSQYHSGRFARGVLKGNFRLTNAKVRFVSWLLDSGSSPRTPRTPRTP
jgi:hypothetical protein